MRTTPATSAAPDATAIGRVRSACAGFTLVELLVAITIMVILTTLVLAAFQRDDGDRLSASARRVQAYLEGARSRAIAERRATGVRLIRSDADPFLVDSLAYVGASDYLEDDTLIVRYENSVSAWVISSTNPRFWNRLAPTTLNPDGRGLITLGARLEIPAGTGNWYTLSEVHFRPDINEMSLAGHYSPSQWNTAPATQWGGRQYGALPDPDNDGVAADVPYRLQFAPAMLPNTEPIRLERGIVIDLHASPITSLDIMFDERGVPAGPLAARGLMHLYLTTLADVELTRNLFPDHPANFTATPMPSPVVPANAPNVPRLAPFLVTIYPQTGQIATSDVDLTDVQDRLSAGPPTWGPPVAGMDQWADHPFRLAQRGQEAK